MTVGSKFPLLDIVNSSDANLFAIMSPLRRLFIGKNEKPKKLGWGIQLEIRTDLVNSNISLAAKVARFGYQ